MLRFFWDEAVAFDPSIEPKDERHMKLSHQGQLGDLWRKAGLLNIKEEPLVIDQVYSSFNDYWEPFTKGPGPGGAYVVSLSEDRRPQLKARMRKRLLGDLQDGPFTLRARAWCVRGEVPWPPAAAALFFSSGRRDDFIEKSAITTKAYWFRVYRSHPNFAQ